MPTPNSIPGTFSDVSVSCGCCNTFTKLAAYKNINVSLHSSGGQELRTSLGAKGKEFAGLLLLETLREKLLSCLFWLPEATASLALGPYPSSEPADLHIPTSPSLTLTLLPPSFT